MAANSSDPNDTPSSILDSTDLLSPAVHFIDLGLEDFIAVVRSIVHMECGAASGFSQLGVCFCHVVTPGVTVSSPQTSTTVTLSQAAAYSTSSPEVVSTVPITVTHQPGLQPRVSTVSSTTVPLAPLPWSHPLVMGLDQPGMYIHALFVMVIACQYACRDPVFQCMWLCIV